MDNIPHRDDLWRTNSNPLPALEGAVLDVQLHTQAHLLSYFLLEQGGTSAKTTGEPTNIRGLASTVDGRFLPPGDSDATSANPQIRSGPGIEEIICAYPWPQGCDYWIGIAWCESTLGQDPNAYADWNPYIGLFQVDEAHGYGREWLKDDANNTLAAWELSHEGTRTSPWPWCQWQ